MPTLTEVEVIVADLFRVVDEFDQYCNTNSEKFTNGATSHEADFLASLKPADGVPFNTQAMMVEAVERFRSGLNTQYDISRDLISTGLRTWADFASIPETSPENILSRLYTYFVDNSYTVKTRDMTLGTPAAAGGNDGNGVLNRLKVDENTHQIESGHTDSKVCRCIRDEASGASKHEEVFELRGEDRLRDRLVVDGSGLVKNIKAISARDSLQYIENPSFERFSGTAATPTAITGWDLSTSEIADVSLDSTITYRDYPGAPSTHYSLKYTASTGGTSLVIDQDLKARNVAITRSLPLFAQVAVYKVGTSSTGNVLFYVGNTVQTTVALSGLTDNGWTLIRFGTGTTAGGDENSWYKAMAATGALTLNIKATGVSVGQVLHFDDVVISPYTEFDGSWYALVGGSTKHLIDDEFTFADTATESIVQKWIARLYPGHYLPHASHTAATWPDPT